MRKGELENVERNRDKSLGITVYVGHRRGNASTSDFSRAALEQTVQAAYDIARFTAEDPVAACPTRPTSPRADANRDLDLFHPWNVDAEQATQLARRCEAAALAVDQRITNCEGAGVSAQHCALLQPRNSRGFRGGYASSRHSISVAPIAGRGDGMQRDAWYSSMRDAAELAAPEAVGPLRRRACAVAPYSRKITTCEVPGAVRVPAGCRLARRLRAGHERRRAVPQGTFLLDSLGKPVLPSTSTCSRIRTIPRGKGSAPFDDEGVVTRRARWSMAAGVQGYFLSSYSARKLGMRTTGNAGGSHNLTLTADSRRRVMTSTKCCASWTPACSSSS